MLFDNFLLLISRLESLCMIFSIFSILCSFIVFISTKLQVPFVFITLVSCKLRQYKNFKKFDSNG